MKLMYRTPDMTVGSDAAPGYPLTSSNSSDIHDILESAVGTIPDNTCFYTQGELPGRAWIIRGDKVYEIFNARLQRKHQITMYQMLAASPNMSDEDLESL